MNCLHANVSVVTIVGLQIADVKRFEHLMNKKLYESPIRRYQTFVSRGKSWQSAQCDGSGVISQVFQHHRQCNNIALRKTIAVWQREGKCNGERNSIASVTVQRDGSAPAAIASIAANMRSYAAESPLRARFPTGASFRAQARIPGIWDP